MRKIPGASHMDRDPRPQELADRYADLVWETDSHRSRSLAFVGEIGALAKGLKPDLVFQVAFVPPTHIGHDMTSPRSWLCVQSYKRYADVVDGLLCVVHFGAGVVRFETQRAVAAAAGRCSVTTSMKLYGSTRPEEVAQLAEAALAGGSAGVSFLGYDVAAGELLGALQRWAAEHR